MNGFSSNNREHIIHQLHEIEFDILIIGGGITGAGIALDASTRGLKVALIEKDDFASGTSSKSTKLIHGGLRYLKQFDFWLVKEVGTERAIVHNLAPHLVVPEKMLLPIIEDGTYGSLLTSLGLKIYDILADVEGDDKRKMLNKDEALALEPLLPENRLEGGGYYAEYRTDDARLTIEVLKTALKNDALALNYCEATNFRYFENKLIGLEVFDKLTKRHITINSKFVINASGPWLDRIIKLEIENKVSEVQANKLHLTKGIHLVFPFEKLPIKQSIYFDVSGDSRMIFAIPRGNCTYVGTTDSNYFDDIDNVQVNRSDAEYLVKAVNSMFPSIELLIEDIQSSWAGLRPLIHEKGKSASELSRKDEIFEAESGLISIAGGKLTGYRKMSERIVDLVGKKLKKEYDYDVVSNNTEYEILVGGEFENTEEVLQYGLSLFDQLKSHGILEEEVKAMVHRYGRQMNQILQLFMKRKEGDSYLRLALAELQYCFENEMVIKPLDYFIRRTGRMYFDINSIEILKDAVLNEFSNRFNWKATEFEHHLKELELEIRKSNYFD